jgi:hypothetical protein
MKPSDFYFWIRPDRDGLTVNGYTVIIVPKELWDSEGIWDDSGDVPDCLPTGFIDLMESEYEYFGSRNAARQSLLDAGFIENQDIINAPRP